MRLERGEAPRHLLLSTAPLNAGKGRPWLSLGVMLCAYLGTVFLCGGEGPSTAFMSLLWQWLPGQARLLFSLP